QPGDGVIKDGGNAVVARTLQTGLRVCDLNAVGDTGPIAALGLLQFIGGKRQAFFRGLDLCFRRVNCIQRYADFQLDFLNQVLTPNAFLAQKRTAFGTPGITPAAVKDRNTDGYAISASGLAVVGA